VIAGAAAVAAEWPQYRGPNFNGTTEEVVKAWPAKGPTVVWRNKIGEGFGSFAVTKGKAVCFTTVRQGGEQEAVFAYDAKSGKPLWHTVVGKTIPGEYQGGSCPRSTPTIV